jgi:hypothetical protein
VNKIVWSTGRHTSRIGQVGSLPLFVISWRSVREDPNWVMSCSLPGLEGKRWKDDDENALGERATGVLEDWLRQVFGILPARAECASPAFEAYAERYQIGHDIRPLSHEAFDAGWLARGSQVLS